MLVMLASAALFVSLRLRADLDDRIDASMRARVAALVLTPSEPTLAAVTLEDPEETFVQLLSPSGSVLDSVGTLQGSALRPHEARRAGSEPVTLERFLPGVDGLVRVHARVSRGKSIVVVGQSLVDRDDALDNVASSFAIGGAIATLLASLIGYLVATVGFAPVEAMRRHAQEVSFMASDEGLPLPAAHDEIRRLGETLNEMLTRLRAAYEREGRFVADASHELRTPIAIIKTELEGALQVAGSPTAVHASLVAAVEECDRLAQLADDLLVIARAADGQLRISPERAELSELLCAVRERFADRARRRHRMIRVEGQPGLAIHADPVRLRQALANLVENALRHGEGEIVLSARGLPRGVEISVSDQGPGFAPGLAAHAFERFARGDRARTSEGVGLGLAIVQAIVQAHGGIVVILQLPPTTLRIWLPNQA